MKKIDLKDLTKRLLAVDRTSSATRNSKSSPTALLVKKVGNAKIKIYQERGHSDPHFHVDFGRLSHVASFRIATGERIEGKLPRKYDKAISQWLGQNTNRRDMQGLWKDLQAGNDGAAYILKLSDEVKSTDELLHSDDDSE